LANSYKVCFIGGARYNQPLDATSAKKFQRLIALGEIFVIGFSRNARPRRFTEYAHFYLLPQWPWPVLRYFTMFTAGTLLALWVILRHRVTIIVTQSPYEGFVGALVKKIARLFGRRVALVVENHGDFEVSPFLQRKVRFPGLYRLVMNRVAGFALRLADALRAISRPTREQLQRWAGNKSLVTFVAWTDLEVFLQAGEEKRYNDPPMVVYTGVFIPLKGVHFLIDAFAMLYREFPNVYLTLIGKEENVEYAEFLKRRVRELELEKQVKFLSFMSQRDLAKHMAQACVLVLPSLSEGLGRVVFEAMACGTPVIGSRVDGIPEMIEDGVTGFLVPPGDVKALAERLRWVLEHPVEAREMGQRAREFAQRFFSPEGYVRSYAKLFEIASHAVEG